MELRSVPRAKECVREPGFSPHSTLGRQVSLYQLQKFLFDINRDPSVQGEYRKDAAALVQRYELVQEERDAIVRGDVG